MRRWWDWPLSHIIYIRVVWHVSIHCVICRKCNIKCYTVRNSHRYGGRNGNGQCKYNFIKRLLKCVESTIETLLGFLIPPASTKLKGGYTGFTLSICLSVHLSVCPSVDRIVSALYLQQYLSDPFHICTSYQATSEGVLHVMFVSNLLNLYLWLCLLLTWDPIWLNRMGNHEAAGGILRTQAF